jgi:hypothetical protein
VHSGITNISLNEEPTFDDLPLPAIKSIRRSTLTANRSVLSQMDMAPDKRKERKAKKS